MHNLAIQQSRVSSEDITPSLYRYGDPQIRLVRVYEPGIDPVEPNPFKFAVVAVIEKGVCVIKALTRPVDGLKLRDMLAGYEHLKDYGTVEMHWRHNGEDRVFKG